MRIQAPLMAAAGGGCQREGKRLEFKQTVWGEWWGNCKLQLA